MSDKPLKKDLITKEWLKKAKDDELNAALCIKIDKSFIGSYAIAVLINRNR